MKKRTCFILIDGLICGHVYYYHFEFDALQVRLLDADKKIICSFYGKPKFSETESLYLCSIDIDTEIND